MARVTALTSGSFLHGDDPRNRSRQEVIAGQTYDLDDAVAQAGIASGFLEKGGDDPSTVTAPAPAVSLPVDDGTVQPQRIVTDPAEAGDLSAAIGQTVFAAPDTVGPAGATSLATAASSEQVTGHEPVAPAPDAAARPAKRAAKRSR